MPGSTDNLSLPEEGTMVLLHTTPYYAKQNDVLTWYCKGQVPYPADLKREKINRIKNIKKKKKNPDPHSKLPSHITFSAQGMLIHSTTPHGKPQFTATGGIRDVQV